MEKSAFVSIITARIEGQYPDPILNALSALYTFTNIGKGNLSKYCGKYKPTVGMMNYAGILAVANRAKNLVRKFNQWKYDDGKLVSFGQTEKAGYYLVHIANCLKVIIDPSRKGKAKDSF